MTIYIVSTIIPNITYRLWIDFDASRSVVKTGSGQLILKPVLRAYTEATTGSIEGTVLPAEAKAMVWAINGTDSILAIPRPDGNFLFTGVAEGSWKMLYDADESTPYADSLQQAVAVEKGKLTTISTVTLKGVPQ